LSDAPSKAFLSGVTSRRVVNTVTFDSASYDHLTFSQPRNRQGISAAEAKVRSFRCHR